MPHLLCYRTLEAQQYVCVPGALHLRHPVNPYRSVGIEVEKLDCFENEVFNPPSADIIADNTLQRRVGFVCDQKGRLAVTVACA